MVEDNLRRQARTGQVDRWTSHFLQTDQPQAQELLRVKNVGRKPIWPISGIAQNIYDGVMKLMYFVD